MATAPSPVNTMLASIPRKWRSSDGDPKQGEGQLSGLLAGKLDAELLHQDPKFPNLKERQIHQSIRLLACPLQQKKSGLQSFQAVYHLDLLSTCPMSSGLFSACTF